MNSAPLGALYDANGQVMVGWAAAEAVAELSVGFGVSEGDKSFVVEVHPARPLAHDLTIVIDPGGGCLSEVVTGLSGWLSGACDGTPLAAPAFAREPVYSTWYAFNQEVDADRVVAELDVAVDAGCRSVFIDDGWQLLGHGRGWRLW